MIYRKSFEIREILKSCNYGFGKSKSNFDWTINRISSDNAFAIISAVEFWCQSKNNDLNSDK